MPDLIELLAVLSGALYGVLLARRHGMDFVGVCCLAMAVAFGGGTLRDLFLDRHPLFWIANRHYPVIVFGLALAGSLPRTVPAWAERLLVVPDALGLGLFSVAGAGAALAGGTSLFVAALLGVVTGTFGGVIADVICNRVPSLFRPAPLYATCSFAGCWLYFGLNAVPATRDAAAPVTTAAIVVLRLAAVRYQLRLPHLRALGDAAAVDDTDA